MSIVEIFAVAVACVAMFCGGVFVGVLIGQGHDRLYEQNEEHLYLSSGRQRF